MNVPIKWVAQLTGVQEVSVLGVADLAYWTDRLRQARLVPSEKDSRAQVLISATSASFAGVRFRELSFAVLVSGQRTKSWPDAAYLVHALNSCGLFAFCERAFFSTPYYQGNVRLAASFPPSIEFMDGAGRVVFRAQMHRAGSTVGREPSRCGEEGWDGPIFLPEQRRRMGTEGGLFFARIRALTKRYPFLQRDDSLTIEPSPDSPVLQALLDSRFVPTEWIFRNDATHAKSKTYTEDEVLERATDA